MSRSAAPLTTLVTPADLASRLDDRSWVVIDARFDLAVPEAGEAEYLRGHVPGAVYVHLDRDLSAPMTGRNGRHPLPSVEAMAGTFGRLGIDAGTQVIVYDQETGLYSSRVWWMLRYLGHDAVAVLDGGFARWCAEGCPTRKGQEVRTPRGFVAAPRPERLVTAAEVAGLIGDPTWRLVDARAPERYRGDIEPLDPVAGHIPGAVNLPYRDALATSATLLPPQQLRAWLAPIIGGVADDRIVAYCGSGVSACHALLAMEIAGVRGARLYAGSWSEWCADPARPIDRGESGVA